MVLLQPTPPSKLQAAALACLGRGGAVVTANARAARWLGEVHARAQIAQGKQAWPTPAIHHWDGWLGVLWKQYAESAIDAPLLLSPWQERAAWKRTHGNPGAGSDTVAGLCSRAWALLSDFNAHGERWWPWQGKTSADAEVFRGWAEAFDRECRRRRWMSRSDLPPLLAPAISKRVIRLPPELLLLGFDRVTPAQRSMLDVVRSAGVEVAFLEPAESTSAPQLVQAGDLRDELATCAWWARRRLEKNPAASIAVVLQDLDQARGEIDRTFREILMPLSVGIESNSAMPFEFSLGVPLATVSVIRAALVTLRWISDAVDQGTISWLIRSGFLGDAADNPAHLAEFDVELRERGNLPHGIPLEIVSEYRPRASSVTVRRLLKRLQALETVARSEGIARRTRTFAEWIDGAENLLQRAHWPGGRTLESVEYQARARWERMTGEIAALGFDGGQVSWTEFVTTLERYAGETIFSPESLGAPIQIMGALESSGQEFDALWFVGADDGRWPVRGQPNPLLPAWLQRKAGMPYSSLEEEWKLAQAITRRLAASATEFVASYSMRDEVGDLRPSPLLAEVFGPGMVTTSSEELRASLNIPGLPPRCSMVEELEDLSSVPWPAERKAGGAQILKRQSACAFQSFAMRRFGIHDLREADRGLNALDRGTILHAVLQNFWSKENAAGLPMRSRSDLFHANAAGKLPEILADHIAAVFQEQARRDRSAWWEAYLRVEQSRLQSVLLQWLTHELMRADFSVEACEQEQLVEIEGLQLRVRVDRVDTVAKGRLILDYKSAEVKKSMWAGERPEEPQLPLYGAYGKVEDLRGVLFAQIRAGAMYFVGYADDPATIARPGAATSGKVEARRMDQAVDEWSAVLRALARDFLAGDAAVAPRSYPETCGYCPLPGLCRIGETRMGIVDDDDESSAAQEELSGG